MLQIREEKKELDFERKSFLRSLGISAEELASIDFFADGTKDGVASADALIIGGSKYGVAKNDSGLMVPKLEELVKIIKVALAKNIPILGICFGHQLLTRVCGGEVIRDDASKEYGTREMKLLPAAKNDPLFGHLPEKFNAQSAHHDRVEALPSGAEILIKSRLCPVQACRIGANVYGVQFHPERSKEDYEEILKYRFKDSGQPEWADTLAPSPEAETIMKKFADMVRVAE